ncbi:peptidoglycan-binding domain-containing protein [Streptomyces sp. NPDC002536]
MRRPRIRTTTVSALLAAALLPVGAAHAAAQRAPSATHVCNYTGEWSSRPTGPVLLQLQCYLGHDLTDFAPPFEPVYGPVTRSAVLRFQGCDNLGADGVLGPRTWYELERVADSGVPVC